MTDINPMDYFARIGTRIHAAWRGKGFDELALPEIAHRVLVDDPAHLQVDPKQPLLWVQTATSLPPQLDFPGRFGQPPLTVFRMGNLVIDVYYWLDATTSIHEHSFSGAFQVLSGGSIHAEYLFTSHERINSRMQLGDLKLRGAELLSRGDTRPILSGRRFIHALFHLDRPSVTVVARCADEADTAPQFAYHRPHVGIDGFFQDVLPVRRVQTLRVLHGLDPDAYEACMREAVVSTDFLTFFWLMRDYALTVRQPDRVADLLARARARQGERADLLHPVLDEELRQAAIISRRRHAHDREQRFFFALLLNAPTRESLLQLVLERYPNEDPVERVVRWLEELVRQKSPVSEKEPNALGLPLDDETLMLTTHLVRGRTAPEIMRVLAADGYDPEGVEDTVEALSETLASSLLLRTLFVTARKRAQRR